MSFARPSAPSGSSRPSRVEINSISAPPRVDSFLSAQLIRRVSKVRAELGLIDRSLVVHEIDAGCLVTVSQDVA